MFAVKKLILKHVCSNIDFVEGANSRRNNNHYKVTYVMKKNNYPTKKSDIKYAMFVSWKKKGKRVVVIGQNPSRAYRNSAMDSTNQNIVKILKFDEKIAGYIMVNTFPLIDSGGSRIKSISISPEELRFNIRLSKFLSFNLKKIVACSTSNYISKKYYDKFMKRKRLYVIFYKSKIITHFSNQSLRKITSRHFLYKRAKCKAAFSEKEDANGICKIIFDV